MIVFSSDEAGRIDNTPEYVRSMQYKSRREYERSRDYGIVQEEI
nr:MAG TPA: hypothetical protein [Caudoviricetes sp.]